MLLRTVDEVVEKLGGSQGVQSLFEKAMAPNVIAMWRLRGRLSPRSYAVITRKLKAMGATAVPELWDMWRPKNKQNGK